MRLLFRFALSWSFIWLHYRYILLILLFLCIDQESLLNVTPKASSSSSTTTSSSNNCARPLESMVIIFIVYIYYDYICVLILTIYLQIIFKNSQFEIYQQASIEQINIKYFCG